MDIENAVIIDAMSFQTFMTIYLAEHKRRYFEKCIGLFSIQKSQ